MANEAHFRKLEHMYHAAPTNAHFAPRLTVSEGSAEVVIPVKREFFHAAGAVHGAVYFKAMDDAAFFAASSLVEDAFVLTTGFTVYLIRPISEGHLRGVGTVVSRTRTQLIAEAVVYDAQDRQIARGSGTFVRSRVALSPELGYA